MKKILFLTIIILAFFLRFYQIDKIPPGPEWDEASVGYNAFSIARTGQDEWQIKLPTIFKAFGDYKNPLYIYLTAGILKFFPLDITTTRVIAALSGSLSVITLSFIAFLLFKSYPISLLTGLFTAFSPFGVFFSRIAGDGMMLSVLLIEVGISMELLFIKNKLPKYFYLSVVFFVLSMFSYNLARIVSPLLLLTIFIVNYSLINNKKKYFVIPLFITVIAFVLIYDQSKIGALSRIKYVGMFGREKGVVLEINEYREHDKNSLISKIFHNKLTFSAITLVNNYISHFSTDFLVNFKEQTGVAESFSPPLYLSLLPFYFIGLILLIKNLSTEKNKLRRLGYWLFFALIIFSPLPSTITEGSPSGKRYLASFGVQEMLAAYALVYIWNKLMIRKKTVIRYIAASIFIVIYSLNVVSFLKFFYLVYPEKYGGIYAARENKICEVIRRDYEKYDYFVYSRKIDGVPYIFPLFCLEYPPEKYWNDRKYRLIDEWYYVDSFDKFIFFDEINKDVLSDSRFKENTVAFFLTQQEKDNTVPEIKLLPILKKNDTVLYLLPTKL